MKAWRTFAAALSFVAVIMIAAGCSAKPEPSARVTPAPPAVSSASDPGVLTVAIAGMIVPKEGLAYYRELSGYVAAKAGKKLRLIHKADYAQVNDMLERHKVDLAFVCSGPYVTGHEKFGLELLCAPQAGGVTTYRSYIIVPRSGDATSLASLRGKIFAFTDPQSNSGRTVPMSLLAAMGTDPDRFFGKWFYTYSHDVSIKAVADGKADGAAVDSLIWSYVAATHPEITAKTRVVWRSEPYAIPPVVVDPAMDTALKGLLRDAFLGADKDPKGRALLDKMQVDRFVVIGDGAYDSIRAMQKELEKTPGAK